MFTMSFLFIPNAETGIRTQGGVTLACFQVRCLKPSLPSLQMVPDTVIEPVRGVSSQDFKACASDSSATRANKVKTYCLLIIIEVYDLRQDLFII